MSIEIPGAVPLKFFELAVEKTLALFIVSDRNVHRFPKCFDQKRIEIVRECAEEHKLQWKLINDGNLKYEIFFAETFHLFHNCSSILIRINNSNQRLKCVQQQLPIAFEFVVSCRKNDGTDERRKQQRKFATVSATTKSNRRFTTRQHAVTIFSQLRLTGAIKIFA